MTKDPLLASWSRKTVFGANAGLDDSEEAVATNDLMPLYAFERLAKVYGDLNGKTVVMLGVSYRGDVGDTRFTPVNLLVTCLENAGAAVVCHDPFVSFWPEKERQVAQDLIEVLAANPSVVVISAGHKNYTQPATISLLMGCKSMTVFDTIGLLTDQQIEQLSARHVVSVLGRGDI